MDLTEHFKNGAFQVTLWIGDSGGWGLVFNLHAVAGKGAVHLDSELSEVVFIELVIAGGKIDQSPTHNL